MKLAVQIASWLTAVMCALMMISSIFSKDGELFIGTLIFAIAPVLTLIYLQQVKERMQERAAERQAKAERAVEE